MTPVKKRKCMNCLLPTHSYKECPDPCRFCNSHDHKARSCKKNRSNIKRTVKKGSNPPNSNSTTLSIEQSSNSASLSSEQSSNPASLSTEQSSNSASHSSEQSSNLASLSIEQSLLLLTEQSLPLSTKQSSSLSTGQSFNPSNISNSASLDEKPPTLNSSSLNDVSTVLSENGVFTISAMTSAATLPSFFKSITILKDQLKFRTNNGTEGSINLHAYEDNVRDVREAFRYVDVNYVNRQFQDSRKSLNNIEYTMKINSTQSAIKQGQIDKIKRVGEYLRQAKYYEDVLPDKIPLRKTDISPADWRIEKYIYWECKRKNNMNRSIEIDSKEEHIYKSLEEPGQFNASISGSIYDDPPDVNKVVDSWKENKNRKKYYVNPPLLPIENQGLSFLSDYIEYLSEGLKHIQYNNEIYRRSELRYCSYLDKAVEMYKEKAQLSASSRRNSIFKIFISDEQDNNKDRVYLCKKKMVGRRLNKIMDQCQLNWSIIDCVEEITANFLTNIVQEETFNTLIQEIKKNYIPKFRKKQDFDLCKSLISIRTLFFHMMMFNRFISNRFIR